MPKIRARYSVKGPKKELVTYTKCSIDPETKSLIQEEITEEMETYMVYFPHGHSIRCTSYEKLKELGYHLKPRMVDMETGDLIDAGGDPYDFSTPDDEIAVMEEDEGSKPTRSKTKENA